MAQWEVLDLGDIVPDVIKDTIDLIQSVLAPIQVILEIIQTVLNIIRTFLILVANPLLALIEAIGNDIVQFLDDIAAAGIYVLYDFPTLDGINSISSFFSKVGGGSAGFKKRVTDSFFDPYDQNRPSFSSAAQVGGIALAFDNQDIGTAFAALENIAVVFSKQSQGWLGAPKTFAMFPGNKEGEIKQGLVTAVWRDDLSVIVANGGWVLQWTEIPPNERFERETFTPDTKNKSYVRPFERFTRDRTSGERVPLSEAVVWNEKEISYSITGKYTEELDVLGLAGTALFFRLRPKSPFSDTRGAPTREVSVFVPTVDALPIASSVKITSDFDKFTIPKAENIMKVGVWTESGENISGTVLSDIFNAARQPNILRSAFQQRLELCSEDDSGNQITLTATEMALDINQRSPFKEDIQATVDENGFLVLFAVKPGPNQVIGLGDGSANAHLGFDPLVSPVGSRIGTIPNWDRVSVQDIFPFIKDISQLIKSAIDALVEAVRSAVDAVIDFIDAISTKIAQLQKIIDALNDFLDTINELFVGQLFVLRVPPEPGGTTKFINTFQTATAGPSSDNLGITFGLVFLVGGPSAADQYGSLRLFF